jgi:hypothetical protein
MQMSPHFLWYFSAGMAPLAGLNLSSMTVNDQAARQVSMP